MAAAYKARLKDFEDCLTADKIDLEKLRKLSRSGCPFEAGFRPLSWKLLLNYLPPKQSDWKDYLIKQRAAYADFINEFIIRPGTMPSGCGADGDLADHPLNPNPDSQWQLLFRDNEMLMQIDKDCRRLCPDLSFFQMATDYPCKKIINAKSNVETLRKRVEHTAFHSETVSRNRLGITEMISNRRRTSEIYHVLSEGEEAHWEVVERILFIYAKLNTGQGYVQGMNEILGPIYYTLATDNNHEDREYAEADSFFCFMNLMSEVRDNFIKLLDDDSRCGIGSMMERLYQEVKQRDPALWHRLQEQDLKPQFYAFRWITLLLSQEFPLPDVLRIWDSLFAQSDRQSFLLCICCAMLMLIRDDILKNDFPSNMKLLQNFPYQQVEVQKVLGKATELQHR